MHVQKKKRRKLDDKSSKCIFLGYSAVRKAYRVYELKSKRVHVTRDVIFDEGEGLKEEIDLSEFQLRKDNGKEVVEVGTTRIKFSREPLVDSDLISNLTDEDFFDVGEEEESQHTAESTGPFAKPPQQPTRKKKEGPPTWLIKIVADAVLPENEGKRKSKMRPTQQVNFALMAQVLNAEEPTTYEEASKEEKWVKAMDAKMQAVQKNQTWDLVRFPEEKQAIGCRWVFKTKYKSDGSVDKYKARLVAKGFK
eukprot:Gb_04911 [translate_table: standard]